MQFNAYGAGNITSDASGNLTSTRGQLYGVAGATAATAGNIGELISSTVVTGSAVALTTNIAANMTSIPLTAGEWDISCNVIFLDTGTTLTSYLASALGTTSAKLNNNPGQYTSATYATAGVANTLLTNIGTWVGPWHVSLSGTTTHFCVAQAGFTVSTMSAFGLMRATRVH